MRLVIYDFVCTGVMLTCGEGKVLKLQAKFYEISRKR